MIVSVDVTAVPAHPVGAGRYTIELVRALQRLEPTADEGAPDLVLWSRSDDAGRWSSGPRARVVAVAPQIRPLRLLWEQVRLPALLRASGASVHHAPHYTMPERTGLPCVVTIHDLTFFDHPEWHERIKVPVFRRAIRRAARDASVLVCVSDRTAELLKARFDVRGEVVVVPHGVDHGRFRPLGTASGDESNADGGGGADSEVLARLNVRPPYVLFIGTIEPRKAVPDLIRAFAALAPQRPELSLVLAGRPGWGGDEVDRAISAAELGDRVLVTGYVHDDDLAPLLRGAAVVAYPAHEEGFGLPALEALACGAPLVTTEGTAMGDVAGDAAVLVPPGDVDALYGGIVAALDGASSAPGIDGLRRRALGSERAARHTWARPAQGHLDAYRRAVSAGHGR
ncbi:MAG: glycosyltransferase family 4 protein [Acidimicrobiales bacterium]